MISNDKVLFGLGLPNGVDQVSELLGYARLADDAGLDIFTVNDHPYFAERLDAYAALGYILGATSQLAGVVICTNMLSRPAPILARTVTTLSTISGGRIVLGMGVGGIQQEIDALGVPRISPGERVVALEEAIQIVRALSDGGDPVTFEGEHYQIAELTPAGAPAPPVWVGVGGPKGLAAAGRYADGWIPPHAADWRSKRVAESRPIIEAAAAEAGRDPSDVKNIFLVGGEIAPGSKPATRDEEADRWNGGGVEEWVEELTYAAREHNAGAFLYVVPPGEDIGEETLNRWAREVVPAVREAIAAG